MLLTMNIKKDIICEIYKPARKNFLRTRVVTKGLYDLYQCDLIDLHSYAKYNKNYKYILVVIDVYSKFAWAHALKTKAGKEVSSAMNNILSTLPRPPNNLQTDHGSEFYNVHFKSLMQTYHINHYSVYSTKKHVLWRDLFVHLNLRCLNNLHCKAHIRGCHV